MITLPVLLIGLAALLLAALVVAIWWQHRRRSRAVPAGPRTVADLVAQRAAATRPTPVAGDEPVPAEPGEDPPVGDADAEPAPAVSADAEPATDALPEAAPPDDAEPDAEPPPVPTDPATPWVLAALMNGAVPDTDPLPAVALPAPALPDDRATDPVGTPTVDPAVDDPPTDEVPATAAAADEAPTDEPATTEIATSAPVAPDDAPRRTASAEPADPADGEAATAAIAVPGVDGGSRDAVTPEIPGQTTAGSQSTPDPAPRAVAPAPVAAPVGGVERGTPVGSAFAALPLAAVVGAGAAAGWAATRSGATDHHHGPEGPVTGLGRRGALRLVGPPGDEPSDPDGAEGSASGPTAAPDDAAQVAAQENDPVLPPVSATPAPTPARRPESLTAEQAAADLALLGTFGPGDLDTRPGRAPVVALEGPVLPERPPAGGAAQDVRVRAVRRDGAAAEGAALALLDDRGREVSTARSGGDGRGALRAPHPGPYLLVATAPGHQPGAAALTVGDAPVDVEVLLVRSAGVTGQVLGEDGPMDGARVTLVQDGEIVGEADADPDGHYRIPDLAGGEYAIAVSAPGCDRVAALVHLTDGAEVAHDVELEPAPVPAG